MTEEMDLGLEHELERIARGRAIKRRIDQEKIADQLSDEPQLRFRGSNVTGIDPDSEGSPERGLTYLLIDLCEFDSGDMSQLQIAYGGRVIDIDGSPEDIDLLKLGANDFFSERNANGYIANNLQRIRTDFINYSEVLVSTWSDDRSGIAVGFIGKADSRGLYEEALSQYEVLKGILDSPKNRILDPNTVTSLRSAVYLFEKYTLRVPKLVAPDINLVYGSSPKLTIGMAAPALATRL